MAASIQRIGKAFRLDVFVPAVENPTGLAVRLRRRFPLKSEAEAWTLAAQIETSIRETGAWSPPPSEAPSSDLPAPVANPKGRTLGDALYLAFHDRDEGWCLKRNGAVYYQAATRIVSIVGTARHCASIDHTDFSRLRDKLKAQGAAPGTVAHRLNLLARVLYFAERDGWITKRPNWERVKRSVPVDNKRLFTFTPQQEKEALRWFELGGQTDLSDAFVLGIEMGLRLNEILTLSDRVVDLRMGLVTVLAEVAKSGRERQVVITPRAHVILERRLRALGNRSGELFPPQLTSRLISARMMTMRLAIGITDLGATFHATRHTCGSRMAERGVPLPDIMEQLGHTTPAMSLRYVHLTASARRKTILEKMT